MKVSSKADQYREGGRASLVTARTDTPTCAVSMMQHYFAMKHESQDKVF